VGSITDDLIRDVAAARGLSEEAVRQAMNRAPLTAQEALQGGFVDSLGYRDQLYRRLRGEQSDREGGPRLRFVDRYRHTGTPRARLAAAAAHLPPAVRPRRDLIAVVGAHGAIHLGRSGGSSPLFGPSAGADTVTAALRSAGRDEHVRAIVLRIDSPGGSAVASDAIRRAVLEVQSSGTPVVASMASLAASGGYFIAMPCERVLATPSTLTGSIGVWGGKQIISDGLARIGVTRATVSSGRYADMFSTQRPFDDDEWARLEGWLDRVYDDFTAKAAADRGMPVERLREVAKGRVWTGADAREVGLVDRLGGLSDAVDLACSRAGLTRAEVDVRLLPKVSPLDRLRPAHDSDSPAAARFGEGLPLAARLLESFGLSTYGVLTAPVLWRLV